jgi:hypothetical protein
MKRRQTRRIWGLANKKVFDEGRCRSCGKSWDVQRAHLVPRRFDPEVVGPRGGKIRLVEPDAIMPLCGGCHFRLDAYALSVWHLMTKEEKDYAIDVLGEERARQRLERISA